MNIVGLRKALMIKDTQLVKQASEDFQRMQAVRQDKRKKNAKREKREIERDIRFLVR